MDAPAAAVSLAKLLSDTVTRLAARLIGCPPPGGAQACPLVITGETLKNPKILINPNICAGGYAGGRGRTEGLALVEGEEVGAAHCKTLTPLNKNH